MAGSDINSNNSTKPRVKSFDCPNCGGAVDIRYPGASLSCVCQFCDSVIDTSNPNYKILEKSINVTRGYEPIVPLGTRCTFFGREWEIIGYMVRRDKASSYAWEEYLLYNPRYGYRFLTLNGGNWSFVSMTKTKPVPKSSQRAYMTPGSVIFLGDTYRLYYRGRAEVIYVQGEFYWRVKAGTEVQMEDYLNPPLMLSSEKDKNERVWSVSQFLSSKEVQQQLKPKKRLPTAHGIAPNQWTDNGATNKKMWLLWLFFGTILLCLQFWQLGYNRNVQVASASVHFDYNKPNVNTYTTQVFEVTRPQTGVLLQFKAPVDNSWVFVSGELVNDTTNDTYPFSTTCEYYHGYDGGESWTEGRSTSEVFISKVPAGKYVVNIDAESGDFKTVGGGNIDVSILQGARLFSNYFWMAFLMTIAPVLSFCSYYMLEQNRWQDSDYSPYVSND